MSKTWWYDEEAALPNGTVPMHFGDEHFITLPKALADELIDTKIKADLETELLEALERMVELHYRDDYLGIAKDIQQHAQAAIATAHGENAG